YADFVSYGSVAKPLSFYPTGINFALLQSYASHVVSNAQAIDNWQALLNYNEFLKATAVEFVDFYQHIGSNARADSLSRFRTADQLKSEIDG
ncbi:hypothetical protein ABTK40_20015, partial [Acinetobacter baumannii]